MGIATQSAAALTALSSVGGVMNVESVWQTRLSSVPRGQLPAVTRQEIMGLPVVIRHGKSSAARRKGAHSGHRHAAVCADHDDGVTRQLFSSSGMSGKKGKPIKASSRRHGDGSKPAKEAASVPLRGVMPGPLVGTKGPPAVSLGAAFTSGDELEAFRGLVLDVSYRPINVVCWKRALCLDILQKADVLEYYDQMVQAPNSSFAIPAVLRVCNFVQTTKRNNRRLSLSRNNIFLRDKFKCQYCGSVQNLTIDHVLATSRGGGWAWENLVTACSPCNLKKGDKSPEEAGMKLARMPKEPRELDASEMPSNFKTLRTLTRHPRTPLEWADYLPIKPPSL